MRGRAIRVLLPLVAAVVVVGAAMAASSALQSTSGTVKLASSKSFGMILVAANGHTLYRYTPDKKGVSVCRGACLKLWPPLLLKAGAKPSAGTGASAALLGTIKAAHGKEQVTYAGFPLHFYAGDTTAGEAKGQGFQSKWYVVNGKGALVKHATGGGGGGGAWG